MAGTVVIHIILFTLLFLVSFSAPPLPEPEEEGLEVNFGTDETGFGLIEPSPPAVTVESAPPPPAKTAKSAEDEPVLTQNTEEAPAVKKVDPELEKKKREKIEADKKKREELEAERIRIRQEEAERKRIEAEQQRQADIMNKTKNALAGSKNSGTSSTSEGIAGGTGNQGDPRGSVDSQVRGVGGGTGDKGISYSLSGRGFQSLPKPQYDIQEAGKVVVEVYVDRSGKVTRAVPGVKGSETLNEYLLKVAKEAALKATFEAKPDAPVEQKGTITYNFILR
jgi:outer membrane biosynthesis protein TonB